MKILKKILPKPKLTWEERLVLMRRNRERRRRVRRFS